MYRDEETRISYKYLKEVVKHLDEPLCLIGGWAVYFLVNPHFEKEKGYPYLGSRDIDLGFKDIDTVKKVMVKLTELGFKKVSFRFFKEVHSETMKELEEEEAKKTPLHYIFPMYVDLIMSKTESSMKSALGFMPIDEPLLKSVFGGPEHRMEIKKFDKKIFLPSPSLLLAMKICSLKGRDKEDKKIKDLCDLTALCLYSGLEIKQLKEKLAFLIPKARIEESLGTVDKKDREKVARILTLDENVLLSLIERLRE